jgi:methylase of polypeptide subunit release factors
MESSVSINSKISFGDFQTPLELTEKICEKLLQLGVNPDLIIEPTCGRGNFVKTTASYFPHRKIIGVEINPHYVQELKEHPQIKSNPNISLRHGDFFQYNWAETCKDFRETPLVIGNPPWVTNAQQGSLGNSNLPEKNNFKNFSGIEALTGKSNFDISEWMLLKIVKLFSSRKSYIAMLCKKSVARKILSYIAKERYPLAYSAMFSIDAKKYFKADVEACLFFCRFEEEVYEYNCDIFTDINGSLTHSISYRNGLTIADIQTYNKYHFLYADSSVKWRSGIKHDCSEIMEFEEVDGKLINGLGETVDIESTYLYPLLKGSDIANDRIHHSTRFVLVTQKFIGEETAIIKNLAPKTWRYLEAHTKYFERRKSKIYRNKPKYSIFGVGEYSFSSWKIAICGLYKSLNFRLVSEIKNKPVIFDDTVYFLSFSSKPQAEKVDQLINSEIANEFFSSLIFWDDKRPIKATILNQLSLSKLEELHFSKFPMG